MIWATAGGLQPRERSGVFEIAEISTRLRDRIKLILDDLPVLNSRTDPGDPLASHIIDRVRVATAARLANSSMDTRSSSYPSPKVARAARPRMSLLGS
jgi:hypothetical protein